MDAYVTATAVAVGLLAVWAALVPLVLEECLQPHFARDVACPK